jgi:hypothetical protein
MLEFCPDQMTEEQVKIWADAQVPSPVPLTNTEFGEQ